MEESFAENQKHQKAAKPVCSVSANTVENASFTLNAGPVLSRFDRFFLIGRHAKGGPALRLLTNANLRLCVALARGPVFFYVILRDKMIIKFFQRSRKMQCKVALIPPSNYTKTLIYKDLGIQMI